MKSPVSEGHLVSQDAAFAADTVCRPSGCSVELYARLLAVSLGVCISPLLGREMHRL